MPFFEQLMPPKISFGAKGGPMFSTDVHQTTGGQRFANANWLYPLHVFDVSEGVKTKPDFDAIRSFFYVVGGRRDGFRYRDWSDYETTNAPLTSTGDGVTFQMTKSYTFGSRTFTRPIYKPSSSKVPTFARKRAGVVSAIAATVDYTTGLVTITGNVAGDTYTWTGDFDIPVAFTMDQLEAVIVDRNKQTGLLMQWPSIQLQEMRL